MFLIAAGAFLATSGSAVFVSPWPPATLALTHLGTLGFVTAALMAGVLETLSGVMSRPRPRGVAGPTHAAIWAAGVACLAAGLVRGSRLEIYGALSALAAGTCVFLVRAIRSAREARRRGRSVAGVSLPLGGLAIAAALGLWMVHGHAGMPFPGDRALWMQVHLGAGLLGWVGGSLLLFTGAALRHRRTVLRGLVGAGVVLPLGALALAFVPGAGTDPALARRVATLAQLPALLALGLLQPAWLRGAAHRRCAGDATRCLWRAGVGLAPLAALLGVAAPFAPDPRWQLLFGWAAVAGWAAAPAHAVVLRIGVSHAWCEGRGSARPAPHALLRAPAPRAAAALHLVAWLAGAAAIVLQQDVLARASGLLLAAAGLALGAVLLRAAPSRGVAALYPTAPRGSATWQGQMR
jgi:hypothetical protein